MSGLYFLGSIIAVFIIFYWFSRNDKVSEDQQTTGILAMRLPGATPPPKKKRRPWSREGR
jgi:hypothetical protein